MEQLFTHIFKALFSIGIIGRKDNFFPPYGKWGQTLFAGFLMRIDRYL